MPDLPPDPAEPIPRPPPKPPPLADKAHDLEAIRSALVDAVAVSSTLWVTYLGVLFYLLVAAGAVTHRDLFFESPVKLPFLGIDLPLKGFFWLGPVLFVILHAYVLLHFVLLAGKIRVFDTELRAQIEDVELRTGLRRQLPSNIFAQFLAGPEDVRRGPVGWMLQAIAWISLVIGPVALLLFFQLQFLAYHSEGITWVQRIAIVSDLGLLWMFWPAVVRNTVLRNSRWQRLMRALGDRLRHALRRRKPDGGGIFGAEPIRVRWVTATLLGGLTLVSLSLSLFVATFPSERIYRPEYNRLPSALLARLRTALVEGKPDFGTGKPTSWWSNILVLPDQDLVDRSKYDSDEKLASGRVSVSLRDRDLVGAVLTRSKLPNADFSAANLNSANLEYADLRHANFECGDLRGRWAECAQLRGAVLSDAQLQGANLSGAQLQSAVLDRARLQGAVFDKATLLAASLEWAHLQGASLDHAELVGASLEDADARGSWFAGARLQSASLDRAKLGGAWFRDARMQGASLIGAQLQTANLWNIRSWRASDNNADMSGALASRPMRGDGLDTCADGSRPTCSWTLSDYNNLQQKIRTETTFVGDRGDALKYRIARLDPNQSLRDEHSMEEHLNELPNLLTMYATTLVESLTSLGCEPDPGSYVATGLIRHLADRGAAIRDTSSLGATLAKALIEEGCAGSRELMPADRATLEALARQGPP